MGTPPKEDKGTILKSKKGSSKGSSKELTVETIVTKMEEDLSKEIEKASNEVKAETISDEMINILDREYKVEIALKNIKLIDLKIEVFDRERGILNYETDEVSKYKKKSVEIEIERLKELRRRIIQETELI